MEILTSEQTVHSAKCYIERDIGALENQIDMCTSAGVREVFQKRDVVELAVSEN